MDEGVLGVVVAGGPSFDPAVGGHDAALTPFAGRYRFVDFALAALAKASVAATYVLAPPPARALAAHLGSLLTGRAARQRPRLLLVPDAGETGRTARLAQMLAACEQLAAKHCTRTVVVLYADHVLRLDLRHVFAARQRADADVAMIAFPVPATEAGGRSLLDVQPDGRVRALHEPVHGSVGRIGAAGFASTWAGDLVVRASALSGPRPPGPGGSLRALIAAGRVAACDVLDGARGPAPYWHDPTSVEEYYDAQMALCSTRSPLDLHDPAWPMPIVPTGLAPVRVVADHVGRHGQTLNAIVSEGAVVRGALVANAVVSRGVTVESGAEVEDSVLLEGCRIGRHARVRRAVIGAGAVVDDGTEIGYDATPGVFPARPSGLTLVPAAAGVRLAAVANAR